MKMIQRSLMLSARRRALPLLSGALLLASACSSEEADPGVVDPTTPDATQPTTPSNDTSVCALTPAAAVGQATQDRRRSRVCGSVGHTRPPGSEKAK